MDIVKKILEYTEVEFKKKLDMMIPELAEKVQYTGYEKIGESRIDLVFKTSEHRFEFKINLGAPISGREMDVALINYKILYLEFRGIKLRHLARRPLKT